MSEFRVSYPNFHRARPLLSAPLSSQIEQKILNPVAMVNDMQRLREKRGYMSHSFGFWRSWASVVKSLGKVP